MRHLICRITLGLIAENDDEALKAIYNRHSEGDFDTELEEEKDAIKGSPEHLFVQVGEKMQQKRAQEKQIQQKQCATRKKSARTLAKEKRTQEEAQRMSQSFQEVYRKLASALHPDKKPDPSERARKTQLMQQVNIAYEKKDLLRLLELQLAAEQIDQTRINTLSETRLAHYNKILSEQSRELESEVAMMGGLLAIHFDILEDTLSTPDRALDSSDAAIQRMKRDILELKADLAAFQEIKNLKQFLKAYRIAPRSPLIEAAREMGVYMSY